jgi:hypothetical protein
MAKNRLVDRARAAAHRSAAESPTESHHRRYQADLSHEIGPTTFGRPLHDDEEQASLLSIMTQPAMILILAIITFALTFIILMWREGRLDNLFPPAPTEAVRDPKAWMLGRNADGRIEDTQPTGDAQDTAANTTADLPTSEPANESGPEEDPENNSFPRSG